MVYEKSFSGQQELNNSQRALNARQRQVLIMIDGKRTQDDLARYLQNLDVAEIIADLERQGYIHTPGQRNPVAKSAVIETAAPAEHPSVAKPSVPITPASTPSMELAVSVDDRPLDSGTLAAVKVILSISAKEHLGLMGRAMVEKIEKIQDRTALLAVISQWHMAIRESKSGRTTASVLIEEVNQLING
jgi:hypothetical protein